MAEEVLKQFEYYYGLQSESFNFIQVPRFLFSNPEFRILKPESKILYSLMLDRMSLSRKNGWLDKDNRVFIYYTVEEMMEDIDCKHTKCAEIVKELINFGLIEKKKQGMGKPDIIYVKDFLHAIGEPSNPCNYTEIRNTDVKTSANSDIRNTELKTSEIRISGGTENGSLDIRKTDTSNTNVISHINNNLNDLNNTDNPPLLDIPKETENRSAREEEEERIKKQINFDHLWIYHEFDEKLLEYIVKLMTDMMMETRSQIALSSGCFVDTEEVKQRVRQLTYDDINNLLKKLPTKNDPKRKVVNEEGYLKTCLFNQIGRRGATCYKEGI